MILLCCFRNDQFLSRPITDTPFGLHVINNLHQSDNYCRAKGLFGSNITSQVFVLMTMRNKKAVMIPENILLLFLIKGEGEGEWPLAGAVGLQFVRSYINTS